MQNRPNILIVEDDLVACGMVSEYMEENGFNTQCVETATEALSWLKNGKFDLLLLDLNLPDFNGLEVLRSVNAITPIPIIVITGENEKVSKLTAFNLGAIDYLVKPIDLDELEARIWAHLRRGSELVSKVEEKKSPHMFEFKDGFVFYQGQRLDLTMTELSIFQALMENRNKVVPRSTLIELLGSNISERSLDNYVKNIRKKLEQHGIHAKQVLKTVYGGGYMLADGTE